jgi:hypothetical protein
MKETLDLEKDAEVLVLLDKWQERVFEVTPKETIISRYSDSTYSDGEALRGIVSMQYQSILGATYKKIYLHDRENPFAIGYYGGLSYNCTSFRTTTESLLIGRCVNGNMFDYLSSFVDRTDHFSKYMGILERHPEAVTLWLTKYGLNKTGHWLCRYVAHRYLER